MGVPTAEADELTDGNNSRNRKDTKIIASVNTSWNRSIHEVNSQW